MMLAGEGRAAAGRGHDGGEFSLGVEEFRTIAAILHGDAGIHLSDSKMALVYSRLVKRLRALGLASFRDYCELLTGSGGQDERRHMLVALTTNVTSFFREPHHFEHLRTVALPPLFERLKRGGRVRLWSAGCSRGHEPYSMAMTILSLMPDAADRDVKILATDIDPMVLEEARAGIYDEASVARVPRQEQQRFLVPLRQNGERMSEVCDNLRRLVTFRELNLIGHWPMQGKFDVIFCRNVLIYFDDATQEKVWTRFANLLSPGSHLYTGHSERITGDATPCYDNIGFTTYIRVAGGQR
jgi:chemotaxis protein methyltransferase CheR